MIQFLKTRLGMFTVFFVVLAGAFLAMVVVRSRKPSQPATETPAASVQTPVASEERPGRKEPSTDSARRPQRPEQTIRSLQQNVPVATYRATRPDASQQQDSGMPQAAVQVIERQNGQPMSTPPVGGGGQRADNQSKGPGPMQMASYSSSRRKPGASVSMTPAGLLPVPAAAAPAAGEAKISPRFLPFGRFIKAELFNALVASPHSDSPLVALVTEDVRDWTTGEVIVPAGSELHSFVYPDKALGRMFSREQWVLVLPRTDKTLPGAEIRLSGMVCEREEQALAQDKTTWSLEDAAPGVPGEIVHVDAGEEAKVFTAAFLSGFASVSQSRDTQTTLMGTTETVRNTSKNAVLGGVKEVMDHYAQQLEDDLKVNGWYMRVNPAKQIYLYVKQTVDMQEAAIGYTRSHAVTATVSPGATP